MKRIFCLILILLGFCCNCQAETLRFIQVTDVHLTQGNSEHLKQFVQDVNNNFKHLDFIVFTGDNIDSANQKDLLLFLDIIKKLNIKPYVLVGNHDLFKYHKVTKESYMTLVHKKLGHYHSKKANYVFQKKNIIFIVMNGVKEVIPTPNGYFHDDELLWLDKMLTKYTNKKVVILQHFPLLDAKDAGHNLYMKENYEEVLKKHNNVISIISGHYHENREVKKDGIYHIITKNFKNNKYYKLIEIDTDLTDDMIFTHLIVNDENQ